MVVCVNRLVTCPGGAPPLSLWFSWLKGERDFQLRSLLAYQILSVPS